MKTLSIAAGLSLAFATTWTLAPASGYTKDEVMGRDLVAEFITDDFKAPVKEALDKANEDSP